MAKVHKPTLIAAVTALALALATLLGALTGAFTAVTAHQAQQGTKAALLKTAVRSENAAANNSPNPACNPAAGAGKLGVCAPQTGPAQTFAKAAGDPFTVRGPLGVDVSSYQGCGIDWRRQGVGFAFFKASEGTGYTDACLRHNVASAKAAHLPYGAYDFLRPSYAHTAVAEAAHFVAAVRAAGANTSLPPVADVEANAGLSGVALHNYVCAWHGYVQHALHRPVTITYTGNWFWGPQVSGGSCGTLLWVSAYASYAVIPHGWNVKTAWQYSDGVFGPYPHLHGWDSDVFEGSRAQLLKLAQAKPPAPTRAQRIRLHRLERDRTRIRATIRSRCVSHHRPNVHGPVCHAIRVRGASVNRKIRALGGH